MISLPTGRVFDVLDTMKRARAWLLSECLKKILEAPTDRDIDLISKIVKDLDRCITELEVVRL